MAITLKGGSKISIVNEWHAIERGKCADQKNRERKMKQLYRMSPIAKDIDYK